MPRPAKIEAMRPILERLKNRKPITPDEGQQIAAFVVYQHRRISRCQKEIQARNRKLAEYGETA